MSALEKEKESQNLELKIVAMVFGCKPEQLKYIDKIAERFPGVLTKGFELALDEGTGHDAFSYITCEAKNAAIESLELPPDESEYFRDHVAYPTSAEEFEQRFARYDKMLVWNRLFLEYMCCDINKEEFLRRYQEVRHTMFAYIELERSYKSEYNARRTFKEWLMSRLH